MPKDFDQFLIRAKDVILIVGFVGSIFIFTGKLYSLPDVVAAHEARITSLEKCLIKATASMEHMSKSIDEIKGHVEKYFYDARR